jgi:hypothetical protein
LNLMKFKREDGRFDIERFKAAIRLFITAQEILVDNACYPTKEIAENSHIFRTLGLGFANLGSLCMSYGLPYDSDGGRALAGAITAIMTGHAYEQSAEIAAQIGAFAGYRDARCAGVTKPAKKDNVDSMLGVIKLHRQAVEDIHPSAEFGYLKDEGRKCWDRALARGKQVGYRNAQVTVLAPTGTIAFLMDCDTTGVEPDIALVKYKLLAGGGMLKIVNRTVPEGLRRLGYRDAEITAIIAHIEKFDTIEDVEENGATVRSGLKPGHLPVFDCAFKPFRGQRSIGYLAHLQMMAAAQPFISGAISKTVNMPNECTVAEIRNTYVEAWKMGLKCVAIYRDGSKRSQPLNTKKTNEGGAKSAAGASGSPSLDSRLAELEAEVERLQAETGKPLRRRLPETRTAVTHKFDIAGHEGYLTVGLFENSEPGELFITMAKEGSTIGGLMDAIGTLTSMALQYGVPLEGPAAQVRPPTLRAQRFHQKPGDPQRRVHHRLRVPLDGHAIHSRLSRSQQPAAQPAGTGHSRVDRGNQEAHQPARARPAPLGRYRRARSGHRGGAHQRQVRRRSAPRQNPQRLGGALPAGRAHLSELRAHGCAQRRLLQVPELRRKPRLLVTRQFCATTSRPEKVRFLRPHAFRHPPPTIAGRKSANVQASVPAVSDCFAAMNCSGSYRSWAGDRGTSGDKKARSGGSGR